MTSSVDRQIPLERSLPRASYVDEAEFARERDAVLFADWFCAGRADQVGGAGDYLTIGVAGESVLVVRRQDGRLSGFYNLCRHRGSRLVSPGDGDPADAAGPSGCFTGCHSLPVPRLDLRPGRHPAGRAVPARGATAPVRVELAPGGRRRVGRVPVRPARPERLRRPTRCSPGWARSRPGSRAYPLAELRTGYRLVYRVAANWKVILENYNECYHCGPVHPELCDLVPAFRGGGAGLDWDSGIEHRTGAYTFTVTGTTNRAPFPGLSEQERNRHKGELVLPNLMLSLSADHVVAFTAWPRSAGQTTVACDFLFHPDEIAKPGFDPMDAVEFWDLVNKQDWAICELVQDGMASRRFTAGYLAPMEQPSADVGRHVASRLAPGRRYARRPVGTRPGRADRPLHRSARTHYKRASSGTGKAGLVCDVPRGTPGRSRRTLSGRLCAVSVVPSDRRPVVARAGQALGQRR